MHLWREFVRLVHPHRLPCNVQQLRLGWCSSTNGPIETPMREVLRHRDCHRPCTK